MSDPAGLIPVRAKFIANLVEDLKLDENRTRTLGEPSAPPSSQARNSIVGVAASVASPADLAPAIRAIAARETSADGTLLVACEGERDDAALAALRNALWPDWHVGAIYRTRHRQITRVTLAGTSEVGRGAGFQGMVLVARPHDAVFAPDVTVEKFDKNATGWNGDPASKGYAHFRWMRRYVGTFADAREARRILDFGCGAGWVGIEASLAARAQSKSEPELCAFDPSPEMVKLFEENAAASGLTRASGRTGFGEDPPFPASGEPRFDLVISSGVISFSGDQERWLDGLARTLVPGATLVIGDIHRESKGMRRRRLTRPLLPVREMNARTREEVRAALERRGFAFEAWCGYQLTYPIPQLSHWSERKLGGALNGPLLWWNRRACARELASGAEDPDRFDSWVMRLRAPRA